MCVVFILLLQFTAIAFPLPSIGSITNDTVNSVSQTKNQVKQNNTAQENLNLHKCNDLNYSIQNNSETAEILMKRLENFNFLESVRFVNNFSENYYSYINKLNEFNSKLELEKTTLNNTLPDVDSEFQSFKLSEKSCTAVSNYYFELHIKPFIKNMVSTDLVLKDIEKSVSSYGILMKISQQRSKFYMMLHLMII